MSRFREEEEPIMMMGNIEAKSQKAILFDGDYMSKAEWIPRSQITEMREEDGKWIIFVKAWLVRKNGWSEM